MRMEIYPWSRSSTRVELIPLRRVLATRRYFLLGHRVLDALITEVNNQDPTSADGPAHAREPTLVQLSMNKATETALAREPAGDDVDP